MTQETIKRFIKEAHENAVDKGFYDCPECKEGSDFEKDHYPYTCPVCNDSRIDPNKNIGELLMLIVSELGEALEAHRCGRFADKGQALYDVDFDFFKNRNEEFMGMVDGMQKRVIKNKGIENWLFHRYIKDTFEYEIADVFIRLFDLCGYLGNIPEKVGMNSGMLREYMSRKNVGECFLTVTREICEKKILIPLEMLLWFCDIHNIPIENHIEAKMAYNKTRPRKHGKEY